MSSSEALRATIAFVIATASIALLTLIVATIAQKLGQPGFSLLAVPFLTLAKIAPAFVVGGRLQPRHPLVVGFLAGLTAIVLINGRVNQPNFEVYSMFGEAFAAALVGGVSMFAGRKFSRIRRPT